MKYSYISDSFFKQEYTLSQAQEYAEMILYAVVAFSLPFILGHEQLLVGSVVNCALVLAALNLRGARLLPVILLPSVGALLAGMVFGPLSASLVYMLPFIWLGNAILVFAKGAGVLREKEPPSSPHCWLIGEDCASLCIGIRAFLSWPCS